MRIRPQDITIRRVREALGRRIESIPERLNWVASPLGRENRLALRAFRNIHRGDRCFIMANGPSLGRMDLGSLAGEITFGLNRIYLLFDQLDFHPTYYVAINELILEQFHTDISELSMPKFLGWNRRGLFQRSDTKLPDRTCYLRTRLSLSDYFSTDVTRHIYSGGTVTYHTLQLAYYMGFAEVILVGLDHSFKEKGVPSKTEVQSGADENHFHPNYWPKGSKWQLPDLYRSELAYARARQAYERDNRLVLDATIGGKCEVFPKVDFEQLIESRTREGRSRKGAENGG